MNRRDFIKKAAVLTGAAIVGVPLAAKADDSITLDALRRMVRVLKANQSKASEQGDYVAFLHPDAAEDLRKAGFIPCRQYGSKELVDVREIGSCEYCECHPIGEPL